MRPSEGVDISLSAQLYKFSEIFHEFLQSQVGRDVHNIYLRSDLQKIVFAIYKYGLVRMDSH